MNPTRCTKPPHFHQALLSFRCKKLSSFVYCPRALLLELYLRTTTAVGLFESRTPCILEIEKVRTPCMCVLLEHSKRSVYTLIRGPARQFTLSSLLSYPNDVYRETLSPVKDYSNQGETRENQGTQDICVADHAPDCQRQTFRVNNDAVYAAALADEYVLHMITRLAGRPDRSVDDRLVVVEHNISTTTTTTIGNHLPSRFSS